MNSQIPQWVVVLDSSHGVHVYGPTDDEDTARDFARFLSAELMAFWANTERRWKSKPVPEHWPPQHGDVWQDRAGDRWCCQSDGTLACLARKADDTPDEIRSVFGPLQLVHRRDASEPVVPF